MARVRRTLAPRHEVPRWSALLPSGLDPADYQVTGSLRDVASWRARNLVGSTRDWKRGDFTPVGYVLVAVKGPPAFIPVARGDEHHRGMELLADRARRWGVDPRAFHPIFSADTGAYVYDRAEMATVLEALRRWHAHGGPEVLVKSTGYTGMDGERWTMLSRDFVRGEGAVMPGPDGILPIGQQFVDRLSNASHVLQAARDPRRPWTLVPSPRLHRQLADAVERLSHLVGTVPGLFMAADYDNVREEFRSGKDYSGALEAWKAGLQCAVAEEDAARVERLLFHHDGLKNRVHMALRHERDEPDGWGQEMSDLFGDLRLADDALGRISPGLSAEESAPQPHGP